MRNFFKNTQRLTVIFSLIVVIFATWGYSSLTLKAQVPFDAKKRSEADADAYSKKKRGQGFTALSLDDTLAKDKSGCGMKLSMFFIMSNYYRSGAEAKDVVNNKILESFVQEVYDQISKDGIEKSTIKEMKAFKTCLATAKPSKSASMEYDLNLKYGACGVLNSAMLETLDYIKKRRDVGYLMTKYESKGADFTGTSYDDVNSPIPLFIGQVYSSSKTLEYKDVVGTALGVVASCYR